MDVDVATATGVMGRGKTNVLARSWGAQNAYSWFA